MNYFEKIRYSVITHVYENKYLPHEWKCICFSWEYQNQTGWTIDEYDDYDRGGSSIPPLYPLTTSDSSVKLWLHCWWEFYHFKGQTDNKHLKHSFTVFGGQDQWSVSISSKQIEGGNNVWFVKWWWSVLMMMSASLDCRWPSTIYIIIIHKISSTASNAAAVVMTKDEDVDGERQEVWK
jgi:hypothetical protein